jgi:cell division protein FtsW
MKRERTVFLAVCAALIASGLVCVYSASYPQALDFGLKGSYFFRKQALSALAAVVVCIAVYFFPVKALKWCIPPLLAVCLVLMLMTLFTRFGETSLGARRWLSIGPLPTFQPSEIVKFASILFLALVLGKGDERTKIRRQVICGGVCLSFALLILLQKDYSTAVVYLGVCICMLLLSGVSIPWVILGFGFLGVGGVAVMLSEPYRVKRIAAFLFPNADPSGINYQVNIARKAIESGGLTGKGLGLGYYKNGTLPEVQNDFILASIAEELGFVGIGVVFALFVAFAVLGYRASRRLAERDRFGSFACFGFTTIILWQALVNAAVVSGLFPPTGIPLPFFSQGGTNLFIVIIEAGFVFRFISSSFSSEKKEVPAADGGDLVFPEKI